MECTVSTRSICCNVGFFLWKRGWIKQEQWPFGDWKCLLKTSSAQNLRLVDNNIQPTYEPPEWPTGPQITSAEWRTVNFRCSTVGECSPVAGFRLGAFSHDHHPVHEAGVQHPNLALGGTARTLDLGICLGMMLWLRARCFGNSA